MCSSDLTVGLGGDRVAGRVLRDKNLAHRQLVSADAAGVGADAAGQVQRGFLAQPAGGLKRIGVRVGLFQHALAQAGAVAQYQEQQLAAGPAVLQPAAQRYRFADMLTQFRNDRGERHKGGSFDLRAKRGRSLPHAALVEQSAPGRQFADESAIRNPQSAIGCRARLRRAALNRALAFTVRNRTRQRPMLPGCAALNRSLAVAALVWPLTIVALPGCAPARPGHRVTLSGAQIAVELVESWLADARPPRFLPVQVAPVYLSQHGFENLARGECDLACTDRRISEADLEKFGDRTVTGQRVAFYG